MILHQPVRLAVGCEHEYEKKEECMEMIGMQGKELKKKIGKRGRVEITRNELIGVHLLQDGWTPTTQRTVEILRVSLADLEA